MIRPSELNETLAPKPENPIPMDKVNPKPASPLFDSQAYSLSRYAGTTRRLGFEATTVQDAKNWQIQARQKLSELLGILNVERVPLEPAFGETIQKKDYTRQTVVFTTRPAMSAFGYWLEPIDKPGAPVVICIPGHGRGVDDLVGFDEEGNEREHYDGYQHDFAIQCVRQGYAVLALEPLGFGHRRDNEACRGGGGASSCQTASGSALMLGETLLGWRVWDVIRSMDLIATMPQIDRSRIALMGISGGGTISLYAAAIDERVHTAVLSCSFCTFKDSIFSLSHCIDNFVPSILNWFEASDLASMIAPRRLFCEAGLEDKIFPKPGVEAALESSKKAYRVWGAADRLANDFFSDGHVFNGKVAFEQIGKWFSDRG